MIHTGRSEIAEAIVAGGLAGGAAEVAWVAIYSTATSTSSATVAREVAASVWPAAATWGSGAALGVAIHMILALLLAAACVPLLLHFAARGLRLPAALLGAIAALVLVWAVNFFAVLPALNPGFVDIMPYGATLLSKVLFAIAMAYAIQRPLAARALSAAHPQRR